MSGIIIATQNIITMGEHSLHQHFKLQIVLTFKNKIHHHESTDEQRSGLTMYVYQNLKIVIISKSFHSTIILYLKHTLMLLCTIPLIKFFMLSLKKYYDRSKTQLFSLAFQNLQIDNFRGRKRF